MATQSTSIGPQIPESAKAGGGTNAQGITPEQRKGGSIRELAAGPVKGEKDNFLPGAYEIVHNIPTPDGKEKVFKMIREDH